LPRLRLISCVRAFVPTVAIVTGLFVVPAGTASAAETVITCSIRVDNPHNSHHVTGTVNVTAVVDCNMAVPAMSLAVELYRGSVRDGKETFTATNTKELEGNAANAVCVAGSYRGAAAADVQAPPGFTPPRLTVEETSKTVPITCR
jgi:hypothetical protein